MTSLEDIYIYILGDIYRYIVGDIYRYIVGDNYSYIVRSNVKQNKKHITLLITPPGDCTKYPHILRLWAI